MFIAFFSLCFRTVIATAIAATAGMPDDSKSASVQEDMAEKMLIFYLNFFLAEAYRAQDRMNIKCGRRKWAKGMREVRDDVPGQMSHKSTFVM